MADPYVYLNGQYLPKGQAALSVEDRGTLFADGVYEVVRYCSGRPLAMAAHLNRLHRSLAGIELPAPPEIDQLPTISDELVQRNGMPDAKVYWQITRGPAARQHVFPASPQPTVLAMSYAIPAIDPHAACAAWRAILTEDRRWRDCWIKSLMLLPNVLARNKAAAVGCHEAIMHRNGIVTEASSANVFLVKDGELRTHPANCQILAGVTRQILIDLARELDYAVREEPFPTEQLLHADEVLLTGTTTDVAAIVEVDGQVIGDGKAGEVTQQLHRALLQHTLSACAGA